MPLQNRVTPEGEIIATPARGTFFGNRGGCFHRDNKQLSKRRWHSQAWITCVLEFKDRRRKLMMPGRYTELFFLDEATALAAGHRPCFECRRYDAVAFATRWANVISSSHDQVSNFTGSTHNRRAKAGAINAILHQQRLTANGRKGTYSCPLSELPSGIFIRWNGKPHLVYQNQLHKWSASGYQRATTIALTTIVDVLTPPATIAVILDGYSPKLHHTLANSQQ